MKKIVFISFLLIFVLIFASCAPEKVDIYTDANSQESKVSDLRVIFIDVGQGDSALIISPNGKTMLIDAGTRDEGYKVTNMIKKYDIKKLDIVVATHPHADHIGGLRYLIEKYDIGDIYMPKASANNDTFKNLLKSIKDRGLKIKTAYAGVSFEIDTDVKADIISPAEGKKYDDLNNMSAVIRLSYKDTSFLFMGDAEKKAEKDMLPFIINTDVIKIGHHGSASSSSKKFIEKVNPYAAVISCGKGNDYGHPHKETIELLKDKNIKLYRTDLDGNIKMNSDGNKITIESGE